MYIEEESLANAGLFQRQNILGIFSTRHLTVLITSAKMALSEEEMLRCPRKQQRPGEGEAEPTERFPGPANVNEKGSRAASAPQRHQNNNSSGRSDSKKAFEASPVRRPEAAPKGKEVISC